MDVECIGKAVSMDCGALGFYQGVIDSFNLEEQTITIKNAVQNGKTADRPKLTISAVDIQDLTFVAAAAEGIPSYAAAVTAVKKREKSSAAASSSSSAAGQTSSVETSTIHVTKKKSRGPAVAESLARGRGGGKGIVSDTRTRSSNSRSYSPRKNPTERQTPNSRHAAQRLRDEDCFGDDAENVGIDFDFEQNLAMFDKQLVFEEIDDTIATSNQPDVVRLVDCNRRRPSEAKFRNDENVLLSIPGEYRPIETGEVPPPGEYSTDAGLIVPAVSLDLRSRLEVVMAAKGIGLERITEMVARAGSELALQLIGGAHRLNPENSHQVPTVVILCGPSRSGVYGVATARHLSTLGIHTMVYIPDLPHYPEDFTKEHNLYKLTGAKNWTKSAACLPSTPVDLVITALEDHEMWQQERSQPWLKSVKNWAEGSRAPVMAIDPPAGAEEPVLHVKVCLLPGLPLWHQYLSSAKLYMANLGVPKKIFKEVGIKYASPFGAKNVVVIQKVA